MLTGKDLRVTVREVLTLIGSSIMESLPCYNPSACCNADCYALDSYDDEPCWGNVYVVDETYTEDDHWWHHACEGHADKWDGGKYKPKPL
jgi:hypothetical protein